jgi:twinkle protein
VPVGREPCPACQSNGEDSKGDNLVRYDNGSAYCFACKHTEYEMSSKPESKKVTPVTQPTAKKKQLCTTGSIKALVARKITKPTCQKFDYQVVTTNGKEWHIANYTDKAGKVVCQKLRSPDKKFTWVGDTKHIELFGQHLWKKGGKRLVITEGEIDALTVSQVQQNKWPVVSLPSGAAGAVKAIKDNLEFVESFETVVLCFDADEAGQKAAVEVATLLTPGRAHITRLALKDPNEYLKNGDVDGLTTCLWNSSPYRPDGIVNISDIDMTNENNLTVIDYPWMAMTTALFGRRMGELLIHTSGSGMGKSTVLREMLYHDIWAGNRPGLMFLEESARQTVQSLIALELNKPVRKIMAARAVNAARKQQKLKALEFNVKDDLTDKEYQAAHKKLCDTGLSLYDHFGSLDADDLIQKMNYMVTALGCKVIYLDHISIVISGLDSGNERKDIDVMMTKLRSFVERTGCRVEAVCHLTKPDGQPFEEGGQISLKDLRGSGSLYQLADGCLGYERNQQALDPEEANTIVVRSLKDRFAGVTGIVNALRYSPTTGRLTEVEWGRDEEGNIVFADLPEKSKSKQSKGKSFKNERDIEYTEGTDQLADD